MHAQAMQQAQLAMHQQMQTVQYLHTAPAVMHPMQHVHTSTAQSYHQQQQANININIHNLGGENLGNNLVQSEAIPIVATTNATVVNDVKISEAKTIVPEENAADEKK